MDDPPFGHEEKKTNDLNHLDLPNPIPINHPWLARYSESAIVHHDNGPSGSNSINTHDLEVYGDPSHPILFRIGNGGAGYTGILRVLCEHFIRTHGDDFRIGWISNHSRHTQAGLLADIVQVALTYEPHNEDLAIREGWCRRVCRAFNDHFILVGPKGNPAGLRRGEGVVAVMRLLASASGGSGRSSISFQTRGDGSATYVREQKLWAHAGVEATKIIPWLRTYAVRPFEALVKAEAEGAYLLTDRATYLTAKQRGVIPNMRVFAEGGVELLNPCSALINTKVSASRAQNMVCTFGEWLKSSEVQMLVRGYGRDWSLHKGLFTVGEEDEFRIEERLIDVDK